MAGSANSGPIPNRTVQINADWVMTGSSEHLMRQIGNVDLTKGAGLYLSDTDTGLLVPADPCEMPFEEADTPGKVWRFYCYNSPFEHTILWHVTDDVPIVSDTRTDRAGSLTPY
jgi:hypothetical protein